jgi:hypothetical protein
MRHLLVTAALLASLSWSFAATADEDDEDDADLDAMTEYLMSEKGLPQADFGQSDANGWFLKQKDGVCTMSSFNDSLQLQVDPVNPLNTMLKFQMFDGEMPEAHGAQVPALLGVRDKPDGDYAVYNVTLTVSKSTLPSYLLAVPLAELVAQHPNGFQLMLKDPSAQTTLMQSDTLGSGKHLAALVACAK